MSITKETLEKHWKDPAVFCCKRDKGLVISASDLEDPGLFEELADIGALELGADGLTIEQVIGRTLLVDVDALTSITADMLDGVNEIAAPAEATDHPETEKERKLDPIMSEKTIHLEIKRLENLQDLKLDIPMSALGSAISEDLSISAAPIAEPKITKTLTRRHFPVKDVVAADKFSFENGVLPSTRASSRPPRPATPCSRA